jgi:acetyl-CoA acyltransferase 1
MERLESLAGQIKQSNIAKSDDDVVICAAFRTPLTKAKKGGLKDTLPEVMLATVLRAVVDQVKLDPKKVDDIVVGNVLQPGAGSNSSRWGEFLADFP